MSQLSGAILLLFLTLSQATVFPALGANSSTDIAYIREDVSGISIGNDLIEIFLNKSLSAKGLPITRITNKMTGWDYQLANVNQHIFSLKFRDRQGNHLWMGPAGFQVMMKNVERIDNGSTLHLSWITNEQFGSRDIGVYVSITVYDDSPLTCLKIRIVNNEDLALYEVRFPIIDGLTKLGESEKDLAVIHPGMYAEGSWLIRDPISIFANSTHYDQGAAGGLYPTWMPVQFISCYDEKGAGGIYIATDDTQGYFKSFEISMNPGASKLISLIKHYPAITFGIGYEPSYSVLLGVYKGSSWQASADIYKSWALKQWWAQRLSYKETPDWFKNVSGTLLGATYSLSGFKAVNFSELASSARAMNNSLYLFKAIGNFPLLLVITGWEANGALRSYPDVFPPIEGDRAFKEFVDQVHSYGMKAGAFFLASCAELTPGGPSMLKEGYKYLTLDEDGNKYVSVFGASGQEVPSISWATTDVSSTYWSNAIIEIGTKLVIDYGFDLLYLDTFPSQCVSYNPNVNHAPGGGNYAFTSWRDIILRIRSATKSYKPDLAIMGEGFSEVFLPYIDGAYVDDGQWEITNLHEWGKAGEAIPLFSYIYHDCTIMSASWIPVRSAPFASSGDPEKGMFIDRMHGIDRYWFMALSRAFVGGKVPTLGVTGLSEEFFMEIMPPEKLHFFEKVVYARYSYAKDFLMYGTQVLSFSKPQVPTYDLTLEDHWWFRGLRNSGRITLQSIETGVWRSVDGRIAYFFANTWNRSVNFTFQVNFTDLGLNIGNQYLAYYLIDGIFSQSYMVTNLATLLISLAPQQIAMVMLVEEESTKSEQFVSSMAQSAITVAKSQIMRAESTNRTIGLVDSLLMFENAKTLFTIGNYNDAIAKAILAKVRAENASWPGFNITVPLKLRVTSTAYWSSILFENALILRVVESPTFLIGKGCAYVASEGPILTGLNPIQLAFEEKYGTQIIYDPSSLHPLEIFEITLILSIKPLEKTLRLQIGKESWSNYETRLEVTNVVDGAMLLNQTQVHGWSDTQTIEIDRILPKYMLTVLSVYGFTEGSGKYTINTTASFSVKAISIDYHNGTRRVFVGWEGDYRGKMPTASILIDSPKTVTAKWENQYYLKIISEHGGVLGEGWYDEGSEAKFTVISEIVGFPVKWIFIGWSGDLKSESNNASILMDSPKTVVANWKVDYTLIPLVIVGVITIIIIITIMAKRRRTQ